MSSENPKFAIRLCLTLAVTGLSATVWAQPGSETTRLLVQHRRGADSAAVDRAFRAHGVRAQQRISQLDVSVLTVPAGAAQNISNSLSSSGLFNFVEPDGFARGQLVPNDPDFGSQWHLATIQAASAWNMNTGVSTVPIAIIDSGVDATHPDLASKVGAGWNFLTGTSNTADDLGHGTAVAGTAAAASDNGIGVTGVAWGNMIMPLVVLDSTDYASYSNIASAITYAADHGARIINISIAGSSASSTLQSAVDYAWNKGVVIFAAAGNNSSSAPMYPAACNNVIAVSATDTNDTLAGFSNYGSWIELSAPGNNILTTTTGAGYGTWYGTSFASPIAAAVAGLVLSVKPGLSNAALVSLLEQNSDDLGSVGYDQSFGWGRVNAYKAVSAALSMSSDSTPPSVSITAPSATTVSGTVSVQGAATDNVGVTKVEFYVDGNLVSSSASGTFSFSWNTTSFSNASHQLVVKAYDLAGNAGQASVTVTVSNAVISDTQPPTVTITSPTSGTSVNGTQTKIAVSASDNVGVKQVSIYIDKVLVYTGSSAPYNYTWNTKKATSGTHVITASAWDAAGNVGSSAPVSVIK